jgi:hypothetical protein
VVGREGAEVQLSAHAGEEEEEGAVDEMSCNGSDKAKKNIWRREGGVKS